MSLPAFNRSANYSPNRSMQFSTQKKKLFDPKSVSMSTSFTKKKPEPKPLKIFIKKNGQLVEMKGSTKMDHRERVKMYLRKMEIEEEEAKLKVEFH